MRTRFIQKLIAGALTVALVVAPSISVFAAGTSDPVSAIPDEVLEEMLLEEMLAAMNESPAASVASETVEVNNDNSNSAASSVADIPVTNTAAGTKSTVDGVYMASDVNGTAVTTSGKGIADSYGLASGEVPQARFYNMDDKKSHLAKAVIDDTAAAIGATVGPCINIEIGKKANGKFSLLSQDGEKISIKVGIPKSFANADAKFAMVCVRKGGLVSVLEDIDSNPDTITFETTGGQGAYAIVRY